MFDIVIHHAKCLDGFTAAWVASKFCPDAQFIPMSYGDKIPEIFDSFVGKKILMVDFSMSREDMIDLAKDNELIVLDHHKTAEANLKGLSFCFFDMNRSGAGLCWDYFKELAPEKVKELSSGSWIEFLIGYVQDRDLWRFNFGITKEINAALGTYPYTFEGWDTFMKLSMTEAMHMGESILRMQEKQILENLTKVYYIPFAGHDNVAVVNCSEMSIISELCNRSCRNHPFAIAWRATEDKVYLSFRSDDTGVDVSDVAKRLGGGGHAHASGAELHITDINMVLPR